jgi:hypothetical protein
MNSHDPIKRNSMNWLLDTSEAGVRYLALRDLQDKQADDPELLEACQQAHRAGPIAKIMGKMNPEGYWAKEGAGYSPKYRSTVWSLLMLAQLGAQMDMDERIARAVDYYLEHAVHPDGQISHDHLPNGTFDCLQGNMCFALYSLGCRDAKLEAAFDWMARTVTGEGMGKQGDEKARYRWYTYQCGPLFACKANSGKSCAWGAAKVMHAFSLLPKVKRTVRIEQATQAGVDFLFSVDPMKANWPSRDDEKPSPNWWKFGFPVFYISDLLQIVEALARLGFGNDPRLQKAVEYIRGKQDEEGRWKLELDYTERSGIRFGKLNQLNKWVTLRALRVLKLVDN